MVRIICCSDGMLNIDPDGKTTNMPFARKAVSYEYQQWSQAMIGLAFMKALLDLGRIRATGKDTSPSIFLILSGKRLETRSEIGHDGGHTRTASMKDCIIQQSYASQLMKSEGHAT